jgi:single-stranded DNA-binding protein
VSSLNRWEVEGGLVKDAEVRFLQNGAALVTFQLALDGTKYDSESRAQVVETTWVSVEHWFPGIYGDRDALYKGDRVYCLGEATQYKKPDSDERPHTRLLAKVVTVTRRGREGMAAMAQATGYVDRRREDVPTENPPAWPS